MEKEVKFQIISMLEEQAEMELEMSVEEGYIEDYDVNDIEQTMDNMIDDGHWAVEEVFESVLGEGYDYNKVVADLFG